MMIAFAVPIEVGTMTGAPPFVTIGALTVLRRRDDGVDVADEDLHHRRTGVGDVRLLVHLTLDVAELGQLEVEGALELRHRDAQCRARRVGEDLRAGALERAHLAAQAEHGLVERERLVDVVGRVNGVHQADHAGLVRGIRRRRLGRDDGAGEQTGGGDRGKNAHQGSPWIFPRPEDTRTRLPKTILGPDLRSGRHSRVIPSVPAVNR